MYTLAEDHLNPDLLFAGTEFGVFFTTDGGKEWIRLKGGLPTICVMELEIQRRNNDLVAATFGRGIYILDDYTPLRKLNKKQLESETLLFAPEKVPVYIQDSPLGSGPKGYQGDSYYTAPNPDYGATFTYYLKESLNTLKKERQESEKKLAKDNQDIFYPSWEDLRKEDREDQPLVILTVSDSENHVVSRITAPGSAGIHRVSWNLRFPSSTPVRSAAPEGRERQASGPLTVPGTYQVALSQYARDTFKTLAGPVSFRTESTGTATLSATDREALLEFQGKTARLQRAVLGAVNTMEEANSRIKLIKKAIMATPGSEMNLLESTRELELRLAEISVNMTGDDTISSRNEPVLPGIRSRVQGIVSGQISSTSAPTRTQEEEYRIAAKEFERVLEELSRLIKKDLAAIESKLEEIKAPWTPGRVPVWKPE